MARELGLRPADVATQVVIRDGISEWVSALAVVATVCEAIAVEVRHGQRTEVRELEEPFGSGQKGSSAMPHKRNPILCERICGLARIVRAQVVPVLEGIPLWHERDISHSSVERVALPDAAIGTDYLLHLTSRLVNGLVVNAARMQANLDATGGLMQALNPQPARHVHLNYADVGLVMQGIHDAASQAGGTSFDVWTGWDQAQHPVYGKTGTAQREPKEDQSWYMCYVGDPQRPIVIAVTVEQGGFGAETAAPIARLIASRWFGKTAKFVAGTSKTR